MRLVYLLSVWGHVLAAVVWIGSMVFLVAVLVPALREGSMASVRVELLHRLGIQLRRVGWVALTLLVATGLTNLWLRGIPLSSLVDPALYAGVWGRTLLFKLGVVATILGISAAHDFWVGPRAIALMETSPSSPSGRRLRTGARWMGRLTLLLSLVVLWLAVGLARGGL
jgi:copper resistance protein D